MVQNTGEEREGEMQSLPVNKCLNQVLTGLRPETFLLIVLLSIDLIFNVR